MLRKTIGGDATLTYDCYIHSSHFISSTIFISVDTESMPWKIRDRVVIAQLIYCILIYSCFYLLRNHLTFKCSINVIHLDFGNEINDPHSIQQIKNIEAVQHKFLR